MARPLVFAHEGELKVPTPAQIAFKLATDLLEIAELAMPDSYFESDSRCRFARDVIAALKPKTEGKKK